MVAIAEGWEPREPAARNLSERFAQDIVDTLREAEGSDEQGDEGVPDIEKLTKALEAARDMMEEKPEGWDVRIVGRIREDGALVVSTGIATSARQSRSRGSAQLG
jgi:hypothetical protein